MKASWMLHVGYLLQKALLALALTLGAKTRERLLC